MSVKGFFGPAVRVATRLTLLLLMPILLIRARPYDSSMLRAALMPAGCAPPCFMGLRPGETTLKEAIRFFERLPHAHFVVQRPVDFNVSDDTAILYWRQDGSPINGSLNFDDGQLREIMVQGLHLYEIWLALGEPDSGQMAMELIDTGSPSLFSRPTAHIVYYSGYKMRVQTSSTCLDFWRQLAYVMIGQSAVPQAALQGPALAQQRQVACEQERAFLRILHEG